MEKIWTDLCSRKMLWMEGSGWQSEGKHMPSQLWRQREKERYCKGPGNNSVAGLVGMEEGMGSKTKGEVEREKKK